MTMTESVRKQMKRDKKRQTERDREKETAKTSPAAGRSMDSQ